MILPTHLKRLTLPVLLSLALAGCGGGTSFGTDTSSSADPDVSNEEGAKPVVVSSIAIKADTKKLVADGSTSITITAIPLNESNIAITEAVQFSTNGSVIIEASGNVAKITSNSAKIGDLITIKVVSGKEEKTIVLEVVENKLEGGEVIANIDFRSDSLSLLGDGSKPVSFTAILKNNKNIVIDGEVVFWAEGKATLVVNGNKATLTPDGAKAGEIITVYVKSGNKEKSIPVVVVGNDNNQQVDDIVAAVDIRRDSTQLLFDGSKPATITVIPKNEDNNAISADVKFSSTGNVTLLTSGNTVKITSDGAQPGDKIVVSVKAGTLAPQEISFDVVDVEQTPILHLEPMLINTSSLSAGGSTGIKVELKDQNNAYAKTAFTAIFTSPCVSNGSSEIESPITSATGVFSTTYTAKGCEGDDEITVTVGALKASSTVQVASADLGAVEFVSAEPQTILLEGMSAPGMQHTSTVKFQIKNDVGGPIANEDVAFELVTPSSGDGGIKLATTTGKTDNNGFVSVILQAGSVHTSVRVRATVDRNGSIISSESSSLVISTGVADQNSLSMSFETLNPAAWNHDGVTVGVTIIASDRYNNPVPDGTTVSFYTELGQIEPSCQTAAGSCVVQWRSSDPRDLGVGSNEVRYAHDGITTITAKVLGEESFLDTNANGFFDDGDVFDILSDKGEAFADYNKGYSASIGYDKGLDRFILDYNGNGERDAKDGKYTGLGCTHSTLCADDNGLKDIFVSGEIVMAEDIQAIKIYDSKNQLIYDNKNGGHQLDIADNPYKLVNNQVYHIEVFGMKNEQIPPINTVISSSSEAAKVIVGGAKVPNTNAHGSDVSNPYGAFTLPLFLEAGKKPLGTVAIKISAGGLETSYLVNYEIDHDSDSDGLADSIDSDDDNDGISDADELAAGTDPFVAGLATLDTDNDGISDADESDEKSFKITDKNENGVSDIAETDHDGDGVSDADEKAAGTDPFVADLATLDTDNDGKTDAEESDETSFVITDKDNNGISDVVEAN